MVVETCEYDNISDLVTHTISWDMLSYFEGINFEFAAGYWLIEGGCTYPDGTIAKPVFDCD